MAVGSGLVNVVLGTATPGGGFPLFGAAFAEALNEADPGLTIETRNTKGSTENVTLLGAGARDDPRKYAGGDAEPRTAAPRRATLPEGGRPERLISLPFARLPRTLHYLTFILRSDLLLR